MNPERLASMATCAVSFDLETHLSQPGLKAPPPVCGALAQFDGTRINGVLVDKEGALEALLSMLADDRIIIVGQNIVFDLLVMAVYAAVTRRIDLLPQIFAAYKRHRVFDVGIAQQLHACALGKMRIDPRTGGDLRDPLSGEAKVGYRLSVIVDLVLNRADAKRNDRYRERYAELEHLPIAWWPEEARQYPVDDVCNTHESALAQVGVLPSISAHEWIGAGDVCRRCGAPFSDPTRDPIMCKVKIAHLNLHDLANQCMTDWCLYLGAAWGFVVDPAEIAALERKVQLVDEHGNLTERGRELARFTREGIVREDGTEDQAALKRRTALAYGCTGECPHCAGTGKVHNKFSKKDGRPIGKPIQCKPCSATGLDLKSAPVPMTEPSDTWPVGQVSIGRDALIESGEEALMDYAHYVEDRKIDKTYIPWLKQGLDANGRVIPLVLRPHVLLETGRTSYGDVVQQLPRKGGVRECVVARPGRVFSTVDYEAGELITHAQNCLYIVGWSNLATALLKGIKPHNALAATILGISYEEFNKRHKDKSHPGYRQADDTRQAAKPANFGFPGRMGAIKLVHQQRKGGPDTPHPTGPRMVKADDGSLVPGYKGLRFCLLMGRADRCGTVKVTEWKKRTISPTCRDCILAAESLRDGWLKQWPENDLYFDHVKERDDAGGLVVQHVSKRLRTPSLKDGGNRGNSIANGYFQGLLADAMKAAFRRISEECYVFNPEHPELYGSRPILFAHDEAITEHDEGIAHEASHRIGAIMKEELRAYCPDLAPAVGADPALMKRWFKGASAVVHRDRLVPWEPSHNPKKCADCAAQRQLDDARKQARAA